MRLIRGAPGSGRTALVFREFKAALAERRTDVRIIVPTATLVRHFQHELARDAGVISPRLVMSLNRFVRECAPATACAPDTVVRLLVRDALRRLEPREFAGVATTDGMAEVILESIRLLENAGCEAGKLTGMRGLGPLGKAFGRIWADVDARLRERGFVSRPELFRLAAEGAGSLTLWLDGFVTLSPIERGFFERIAQKCEINITALDDPKDEVRRWALERGARDQLVSGSVRRPPATHVVAANVEREADEIARRVLLLRNGGTNYRDIAVAVRDIATYRPLLESAFQRFGIPARFYFSRPLRSHPAGILLSGLIACAIEGWDFESTLAALRAHPAWGASAAFDRFDFAVREAMPGRGAAGLLQFADDESLRQKLELCFAPDGWRSEQRTPRAWARALESWAEALYRPGRINDRDELDVNRARSHAAALKSWTGAIETALAFWPEDSGRINLDDFWAVAGDAAESASVDARDDRFDVVHVMNALEARQWNVATLFVCGLTDRDYPRVHPRHLLLTAADTEKLAREGFRVRTAEDQDADECRLFQSLASRATDSFVLTWPGHDASGRGVAPSRFITGMPVAAVACAPAAFREFATPARAGRIQSERLLVELAQRHKTISTTHIESLAQCWFKFFASRTLQIEGPPERPHERMNQREAGLILHETLEQWLQDRSRNFADLFEQVFENACTERHLPRGYRLEVARFTLSGIARRVSASDSWPVESSEVEVDVTLPLIDGVTMTGRVDRVDHVGGANCVVIDYKSKGKAGMKRLVESETALQGPLYALALRRNFGLNTVAMAYWAVREDELHGWGAIPGYTGRSQLAPLPEDWENKAWTRIAERLTLFMGGNVAAVPTHTDGCTFCDARDCCRVEETQQRVLMIETASA